MRLRLGTYVINIKAAAFYTLSPRCKKISLDMAVSTQKAWHYGETFWTFPWQEWHMIAESHQYHCFMDP